MILNLPFSYDIAINYLKKSLLLLSNPEPPLSIYPVYSQKSTYVLLHPWASSDIKAVKWLELMWPDINTTYSSRACCTVILPRASCHENKFTWKLSLLCRGLPSSQGLSPPTFLVAWWCCSSSLLLVKGLGNDTNSEFKPSWLWHAFSFFLPLQQQKAWLSALQRRAWLGLLLRLRSGLHLKLSFPDCFSC